MLYRNESMLGVRVDRKLRRAVKDLRGGCELLAEDAGTLEYQMDMTLRGQAWGEILKEIQAEAFEVLGLCEYVRVQLDKGAGICRS